MPGDAREIAQRLGRVAPALCAELLPAGKREGAEWRCGSVAGEPGKSLSVHLFGTRAGVWSDFSTGEVGDALDLVAAVRFAGDKRAALDWSRSYLGLPGYGGRQAPPVARVAPPAPPPAEDAQPPNDDVAERRRKALAIFLAALPDLRGTPVDLYLRGRGIDLASLGRQPRSLRCHPALWCREARARHPALVAAVVDAGGQHVAIHRTFLECRGGLWRKSTVENPKRSLGVLDGGLIRLWRGESGRPLAAAPEGEAVVITEGIEDALSIMTACPQWRVLCAVSLANMGRVALPPAIRTVIIAADNDAAGSAADRGLQRAVDHFASQGRAVRIARSPIGKDFNDCIIAGQ